MSIAKPVLWRVPEAAASLSVAEKTLRMWIGSRKVGVVRLGRSVRVPQTEIDRLITEGFTPARR